MDVVDVHLNVLDLHLKICPVAAFGMALSLYSCVTIMATRVTQQPIYQPCLLGESSGPCYDVQVSRSFSGLNYHSYMTSIPLSY